MSLVLVFTVCGLIVTALFSAWGLKINPANRVNRNFFCLGLMVCIWGAAMILRFSVADPDSIKPFFLMAMFGAMGAVFFVFRFARVFLEEAGADFSKKGARRLEAGLLASGLLVFLVLPVYGMNGYFSKDGGYYVYPGNGYIFVVVWGIAGMASAMLLMLIYGSKIQQRALRMQAYIIAAAPVVPLVAALVTEVILRAYGPDEPFYEPFCLAPAFQLDIAYGVRNFNLMAITPASAAGSIVNALPDGLVLLDVGDVIRSANPAFLQLTGRTGQGVIGIHLGAVIGADQVRAIAGALQDGTVVQIEVEIDGNSIPLAVTVRDVTDLTGAVSLGRIIVFRDLRQIKRLESGLIQAEKLASIGTLAAGVAHELNNPLTAVEGFATIINSSISEGNFATVAGHTAKILQSAGRMRRIVDHLRVFARDSEDRHWTNVNLNDVIKDALILLETRMKLAGITISFDLGRDVPAVWGEKVQLESVIQNPLVNSIDAFETRPTGGDKSIEIATRMNREGGVELQYRDNAGGLSATVQKRIFDPFYTTKDPDKGTGLGLSIVYGIVDKHRGTIKVDGRPGVGAEFTITLPASEHAAVAAAPATMPGEQPPATDSAAGLSRVMVIDDEPFICELLQEYLKRDFAVETYADSVAARERLGVEPFDIVITDVKMPVCNGFDILARAAEVCPQTPVVLITGHARGDREVEQALAAGAVDIIFKPFGSRREFVERIRKAMASGGRKQVGR